MDGYARRGEQWHAQRVDLLSQLADAVTDLARSRERVLVGIDGPDAAGKTTLADRLAEALDLPTVRASIDGFHLPREQRYQRGEMSPEGYYLDSFDHRALVGDCLVPFRDGAPRIYTARYEYRSGTPTDADPVEVPTRAVLLFDGVFLLREQLRGFWNLSIYVHVSQRETLRRARTRDLPVFGSAPEVDSRYRERYLPGHALYRDEVNPESLADIIVDNEIPDRPRITRWRPADPHRTGSAMAAPDHTP